MPRANRYSLPGHVWHVTHRCHRQQFLLKFARDRRVWRRWLFDARQRFGLCVLDFIVTSNPIHLLVQDRGRGEIAQSMQLVAGRTAQAYNHRKQRRGAYWEDRYHATAVDAETHLARCIAYIDLNRVSAGAISHPEQWETCGYREIRNPRARYRIIDYAALMDLMDIPDVHALQSSHRAWIDEALKSEQCVRDERWSRSLAIGSPTFVSHFQAALGTRAIHRIVEEHDDGHVLREENGAYEPNLGCKNAGPGDENVAFPDESV